MDAEAHSASTRPEATTDHNDTKEITMKLRVFFITHKNFNWDTKKYKIQKCSQDFDCDLPSAKRQIFKEHGGPEPSNDPTKPYNFSEVVSSRHVDETTERPEMEAWLAIEQSLLSPEMLHSSISYAPGYRPKRAK